MQAFLKDQCVNTESLRKVHETQTKEGESGEKTINASRLRRPPSDNTQATRPFDRLYVFEYGEKELLQMDLLPASSLFLLASLQQSP